MKNVKDLYEGAERLINLLIRKESTAQGHYLTGALEDSLQAKARSTARQDILEGFAVKYADYVDQGVPAESVSWKQWPFLIKYFQQRGLEEKEAKAAAAATIQVWMKEGMSTQASKRFSQTGARQHMVEAAFTGGEDKIDDYMSSGLDYLVEQEFQKEKSETV